MYGYHPIDGIFAILIALGFLLLVFLILRKLVLWYFRIDERTELQKEQNEILKRIAIKMGAMEEEKKDSSEDSQSMNPENQADR